MILHADRGAPGAPLIRNGCVVHDSEGQEGTLPWGQLASAQLVSFLARPGDRPSTTRPGGFYGSGYSAVACEDGSYVTIADDNIGPYHAGGGINPNMWSVCIPGKASQNRDQWLGDVSRQYIRAAARYIVDRWNHDARVWPLSFASGAQLRAAGANVKGHPVGYTSHAQVTVSKLVNTDHSDPGVSFPWDVLAADITALVNDVAPPVPQPSTFGVDMPDQLYRKQGKAAVWKGDRISRTHVNSEQSLNQLIPKYGPVVLLDETADLAASVGAIVVGNDPGDV